MNELFETVLILSLSGFLLGTILLALKPFTEKKFPARWQYYAYILVLISMIVPFYKFIPEKEAQRLSFSAESNFPVSENSEPSDITFAPPSNIYEEPAYESNPVAEEKENNFDFRPILPFIWLLGVFTYLSVVIISYIIYLLRKRKNSFFIKDNLLLENVKKELGIKKNISLKLADDISSPMLVGLFYPTIYIPSKDISDENMRMVFLHELTHYKRRDLYIKWFSLFINAIHWFNPLAYLLCKNLSQSLEIACDMKVTHNMDESEQKLYMKTILDLAS